LFIIVNIKMAMVLHLVPFVRVLAAEQLAVVADK
jgi:hypothetical protein